MEGVTFCSLQTGDSVIWSLQAPYCHHAIPKPSLPGVWRLESMETGVKKARCVPRDAIGNGSPSKARPYLSNSI